MINYITKIQNIEESQLKGFFVGWPNPPSEETFLKILKGSYRIVLAIESDKEVYFLT